MWPVLLGRSASAFTSEESGFVGPRRVAVLALMTKFPAWVVGVAGWGSRVGSHPSEGVHAGPHERAAASAVPRLTCAFPVVGLGRGTRSGAKAPPTWSHSLVRTTRREWKCRGTAEAAADAETESNRKRKTREIKDGRSSNIVKGKYENNTTSKDNEFEKNDVGTGSG